MIRVGQALADLETIRPGGIGELARREVAACAFEPAWLDDVQADAGADALTVLGKAAAVGLSVAAALLGIPVASSAAVPAR